MMYIFYFGTGNVLHYIRANYDDNQIQQPATVFSITVGSADIQPDSLGPLAAAVIRDSGGNDNVGLMLDYRSRPLRTANIVCFGNNDRSTSFIGIYGQQPSLMSFRGQAKGVRGLMDLLRVRT